MSYRATTLTGVSCRNLSVATLFVCLFAASAGSAYGQTLYGSLTGNVTDSTGAAIPGPKVEALNMATSLAKTDKTDERGVHLSNALLHGTYQITLAPPT